jgi:signal transduction histidine kinase/CheY-like chemotaxis protein
MVGFFQRLLRVWFDLPLKVKGTIVISIPLSCIILSIVASHIFQTQRTDLTQWIFRAFNAGTRIQSVNTLLVDAENGIRGFLLTQDVTYLEPYHKAERELPQRLERLKDALRDSGAQLQRVERVALLSRQRLDALSASLASPTPASVAERLDRGRSLSMALDQEFTAMRNEESRLWATRIASETAVRKRLYGAMYFGGIVSLLAGSLAMALFLTGIARRSQLLRQNADRLACGEPLVDLPPGADEIGRLGDALARSSRLLTQREGELLKLNQELDRRVQDRTALLEQEIVERKRSEQQLLQSQKMEAVGRLAGGVAHDFNNILTVLIGFTESLSERLGSHPEAKEDLDEILRACEHASSLTRQLLAFSRRQIVVPAVVDLNTIVASSEKFLRRVIGEDIELQTLIAPAIRKVRVDPGQIEQVIMNLAVNARDAMPTGGRLVVRTEAVDFDEAYCATHLDASPGHYVMLSVSDTGHGMTPEVKARLFEPFFTTKERGKGTGLGLSMVYGIVKQNGGSIWVYSETGMGTTFKIYLPAIADGEEARIEPASQPTPVQASATILLVEDEPSVRQVARNALVRCGYTVLAADGAEAARDLCREHPGEIELLLTDVIMPKTNGRQLSEEIRRRYPEIKVLFMSGYTDEIITNLGVDPAAAFIEKPFTPKHLASRVREILEDSGSQWQRSTSAGQNS